VDLNADYATAAQMEMQYNHEKEQIQLEYEQNKRDTENQLKITRQQNQNRLFLSGVFMFLLISIGLFSRLRYIRKSSRELKNQKELAEKQKQIAEFESRRATESEKVKQLFLANMSHEIRTPMNAIKGMTDILLRNDHPPSQEIYLNAIKKSSESLLVILNDILDLSKLDAGKIEIEKIDFQPMEVVNGIYNLLRYKAEEKGLQLFIQASDDIPKIKGDPTRLHQILVNLANNAIKFTEKGSVTIEVNNIRQDGDEVVLQFKVIDTGIGIVKEKIADMFELFTQADTDTTRKYGGTGLGLSICRRLVNLQNGEIHVESETQVGSTFTVEIPYEIADVNEPASHADAVVELKDIDILLVEDNEFNVIVACDELQMNIPGVKVDTAENGMVALEKVKNNDYDIILMDIQMPEMDGWQATKHIRKLHGEKAKVPIIAMTAFAMKSEIDKCFEAGMNAYVPKPFRRDQLLKALSECLQLSPVKRVGREKVDSDKRTPEKTLVKGNGKITSMQFLKEFCKGDEAKMSKYINMYLKSTPGNLEKIQAAFDDSDFKQLKLVVHSMKPHLNFMGMTQTRELAEEIEGVLLNYFENEETYPGNSLNGELSEKLHRFLEDCNKSLKELVK
jgi:signal transduction histidine kinase/DNA-binding response OmpR family regulator